MSNVKEKEQNSAAKVFFNGLIKENPTFVLMLGMCPTLAVTTSAINGLGMGLTTTVVLVLSNMIISLLRNIIPDKVRIPAFIVIIASFVTMVELLLEGFIPSLYDSLGIYIPLIVVNCIILGRAEAFASKNNVVDSIMDAIGISLGFLASMVVVALFREVIGTGQIVMKDLNGQEIFAWRIIPLDSAQAIELENGIAKIAADANLTQAEQALEILKLKASTVSNYAIPLFVQPTGAFLVLGICVAVFTAVKQSIADKKAAKEKAAKAAAKAA